MSAVSESQVMYTNNCTRHLDEKAPCSLQCQAAAGVHATRRMGAQAVTVSVMDPRDPGHVAVAALGSIGLFVRAHSALERHRRAQLGEPPGVVARLRDWIGGKLG